MLDQTRYARVRTSLGVFVDQVREPLRVTGKDRARFLQGMLSNDVLGLKPGQGCHAAWLTAKGKVLADLGVAVAEDAIWLLCPSGHRDAVAAGLDRYVIADDVQLTVPDEAVVAVAGPGTAAAVGGAPAAWGLGRARVGDLELTAVGWRETGLPGALLLVPPAAVAAVVSRVAGDQGPTGPDVAEVLRVEAGVSRFGAEFDENTLVLEAGLDDCVSYTKGCYVGQETVARQHTRGHVSRVLRGLEIEPETVPAAGDRVSACGREDGGLVTSAVFSPTLNSAVAIAWLHRLVLQSCKQVTVHHGEQKLVADIVELPFVAPAPE